MGALNSYKGYGGPPVTGGALFAAIACLLVLWLVPVITLSGDNTETAVAPNYDFRLTKGRGVPVCDAFLKRLRATDFKLPPYCDIPEDDSVKGFSILNRVPLPEEKVIELLPHVFAYFRALNQSLEFAGLTSIETNRLYARSVTAWLYEPLVNLNNSGPPQNVVLWQGPGADDHMLDARCGDLVSVSTRDYAFRTAQLGMVLDAQNDRIDEAATRALFGRPGENNSGDGKEPMADYPRFSPYGFHEGIFEYRGTYFLETFYDYNLGDINGNRKTSRLIDNVLAVFRRDRGKTRQVCEYLFADRSAH